MNLTNGWTSTPTGTSRRTFLGQAGAVTAAALASTRAIGQVLGANERLGIGFIGCGGRGNNHIETVTSLAQKGEKIEIVAVCDTYRPRADKSAKPHRAKAYMDYRELLADPKVDLVCIATPDHHHGGQAIEAIRAKKDVYCEKPVTHWRQFELTRRLVETVEASKQIFQIGTQGMSDTAWHQAKKLIDEGLIGQPIHAECGYFRVGDWGERGMPIDDPTAKPGPDLNWEAFLGDAPKRPFDVSRYFRWRMYEDYSGGPATDLYPHCFTPVVYMLGLDMPSEAVGLGGKFRYSEREVPDSFSLLVNYPNKVTVAVLGTQGNDFQGSLMTHGSAGRCPTLRGWEGTLTFDGPNIEQTEIVFIPAGGSHKKPQRIKVQACEDQPRFWRSFLECCRTRQQPLATARLAYRVQTPLQMATLAMRAGKIARYDPQTQMIVV